MTNITAEKINLGIESLGKMIEESFADWRAGTLLPEGHMEAIISAFKESRQVLKVVLDNADGTHSVDRSSFEFFYNTLPLAHYGKGFGDEVVRRVHEAASEWQMMNFA